MTDILARRTTRGLERKMYIQVGISSLYICVVIVCKTIAESRDVFNSQISTGQKLTDIFGISFEQCKDECDSRMMCASISYARRKLLCELYMDVSDGGGNRLDLKRGYVHYSKNGISQKYKSCSCSVNEKCTVSESGITSCSTVECYRPSYPEIMTVFGNMNTVGSKTVVECKPKWRASGILKIPSVVIECDVRGQFQNGFDERKCGKEIFMFRKGLGGARAAWKGIKMFTNKTSCNSMGSKNRSCDLHFRDDDMDQWESLNISRVLLSVYKNEEEVHYVLFNGTGTDRMSWFSQENVIHSSWSDITTVQANYFSIVGYSHYKSETCLSRRRFYMSAEWGGCSYDSGWLLYTITERKPGCCDYETPEHIADILYSRGPTSAVFDDSSLTGRADFCTVVLFSV